MKVFLVMQRLVENSIRNYSAAGMRFISPRAVFSHKSIASGADSPVGISTVNASPKDYFTWLLHNQKGTLKLFHISVY